jgi:chemotaxis protein methyltransferase CheR
MTAGRVIAKNIMSDPHFGRLKSLVLDATGLAYYADKDTVLADRIGRRLDQLGFGDCLTYFELVSEGILGEREFDALIAELTVGETFFFRYPKQFDALRDTVLPACIERNRASRRLRIWCAGCATGPEPYSIAIMIKHAMGARLNDWHITILGTDINREFLSRAQDGRYGEWMLRGLPDHLRRACFSKSDDQWLIKDEYKEWTSFQYHNLVKHPIPSIVQNIAAFDIILCRNVMIYFNQEINAKLARRFHDCLVDGGWLLVGHAEPTFELNRLFSVAKMVDAAVYQRTNGHPVTAPLGPAAAPCVPDRRIVTEWKAPALDPVERRPVGRVSPAPSTAIGDTPARASAPAPMAEILSLANNGELAESARLCKARLEKDPLDPVIRFYHALILEQMGARGETMEELQRVIYLDRNFTLAHYHLGLLRQAHGNNRQAKRHFKNALAILSETGDGDILPASDGMTAGELRELVELQLEILV